LAVTARIASAMRGAACIKLDNVTVEYPIYSAFGRSLKRSVLHLSTGGRIGLEKNDRVVVRALEGITLTFEQGDRVGLIGSNGAGKTTLLRLLAGIYEPVLGFVQIEGKVSSLFDLWLGIDPESTGTENILLRGLLLGLTPQQIRESREEITSFADLGDYIHMPLRTYSAGMGLRLAFAVSTSIKPDILLMDEWISVGDANFTKKAEERMNNLIGNSGIMVVASHSLDLIRHTCNRAVWLDRGIVRADGDVAEVIEEYRAEIGE
jgi:ABC-type polysaccharide/polyol phosphate transport system ATPase subunit